MKSFIFFLIFSICHLALYSQNQLGGEKVLGKFVNDELGDYGVNMTFTYEIDKKADTTYHLKYKAHHYASFKKAQNYNLVFKNIDNIITYFQSLLIKTVTSPEEGKSVNFILGDYSLIVFKKTKKMKHTLYICFADKELLKKQYSMGDKDFFKMMNKAYEERIITIEFTNTEESYIIENIKHLFGS